MQDRLRRHVEGLFKGAPDTFRSRELKEELITNLIDKYNDLVEHGMEPERAYSATVAGIGDIDELLGREGASSQADIDREEGMKRGRAAVVVGCIVLLAALIVCLVLILTGGSGATAAATPAPTSTPEPVYSDSPSIGEVIGGAIDGVIDGAGELIDDAGKIIDGIVGAVNEIGSVGSEWEGEPFEGTVANGQVALDAASVSSIGIKWATGGVRVLTYQGKELCFEQTGSGIPDEQRLRYSVKDGTLLLCEGDGTARGGRRNTQLTVYLPTGASIKELSLAVADANAELSDVGADKLTFNSASGGLSAKQCAFKEVKTTTASGGIGYSGSFEKAQADTVSGKVYLVTTVMPTWFKASSISADIILSIPDNSGFKVVFDTVSGELSSDFGGVEYGDGSADFEVKTVSGSFGVRRTRG